MWSKSESEIGNSVESSSKTNLEIEYRFLEQSEKLMN